MVTNRGLCQCQRTIKTAGKEDQIVDKDKVRSYSWNCARYIVTGLYNTYICSYIMVAHAMAHQLPKIGVWISKFLQLILISLISKDFTVLRDFYWTLLEKSWLYLLFLRSHTLTNNTTYITFSILHWLRYGLLHNL